MSKYEEIEAFVRTVESGSFTAAAKQLGVAKSAISRRIGELEARLGAQLIIRSTRQLSLTEAGHALHQRAQRLLADWAEAEAIASDDQSQLSGTLRIAAPLSFGIHHLGPALLRFHAAHPDVTYDIDFSDRRIDLIAEGVDVAIRIGRLEDSSLIARKLSPIHMIVGASPKLFGDKEFPKTPSELSEWPELRYKYRQKSTWTFTDANGRNETVDMPPRFTATNGDFLTEAAIAGLGIVIQPSFLMYEQLKSGQLIRLLEDYTLPELGLYAVYPPTRHLSKRVRALIDFLSDYCGPKPYWDEY